MVIEPVVLVPRGAHIDPQQLNFIALLLHQTANNSPLARSLGQPIPMAPIRVVYSSATPEEFARDSSGAPTSEIAPRGGVITMMLPLGGSIPGASGRGAGGPLFKVPDTGLSSHSGMGVVDTGFVLRQMPFLQRSPEAMEQMQRWFTRTFTHELGHTVGLDHPESPDDPEWHSVMNPSINPDETISDRQVQQIATALKNPDTPPESVPMSNAQMDAIFSTPSSPGVVKSSISMPSFPVPQNGVLGEGSKPEQSQPFSLSGELSDLPEEQNQNPPSADMFPLPSGQSLSSPTPDQPPPTPPEPDEPDPFAGQEAAYNKFQDAYKTMKDALDQGEPFQETSPAAAASQYIYGTLYSRHGMDYSPDEWASRVQEPVLPISSQRPLNPSFTTVRGGPTAAPRQGATFGEDLAQHLRTAGIPESIAAQLEQVPVSFGRGSFPDLPGAAGYYIAPGGEKSGHPEQIVLKNALNLMPEPELLRLARHEAIHSYDWHHGISRSPEFQKAFLEAMIDEPDKTNPFLSAVPANPASKGIAQTDWWHLYTAGFDVVGNMNDMPDALKPFYEGLLPDRRPAFPLPGKK